jgi:hypothetical protein
MGNLHKLSNGVEGTLVKDFNPKYKTIELIESREIFPFGMPIGLFKLEKVKKYYGDRKITSVMDFNDTHTTSICIEQKKERQKA